MLQGQSEIISATAQLLAKAAELERENPTAIKMAVHYIENAQAAVENALRAEKNEL